MGRAIAKLLVSLLVYQAKLSMAAIEDKPILTLILLLPPFSLLIANS